MVCPDPYWGHHHVVKVDRLCSEGRGSPPPPQYVLEFIRAYGVSSPPVNLPFTPKEQTASALTPSWIPASLPAGRTPITCPLSPPLPSWLPSPPPSAPPPLPVEVPRPGRVGSPPPPHPTVLGLQGHGGGGSHRARLGTSLGRGGVRPTEGNGDKAREKGF